MIIINTHGRFAIAFLPLTTRLSTELFEAVFIKKFSEINDKNKIKKMKCVRPNEHAQCFSGIYNYKNESPSTWPHHVW